MIVQFLPVLLRLVETHNEATGHEIIPADDIPQFMFGYACLECKDDEHTWEVRADTLSDEDRRSFFDERRIDRLNVLNRHTRERVFDEALFDMTIPNDQPIPLFEHVFPQASQLREEPMVEIIFPTSGREEP